MPSITYFKLENDKFIEDTNGLLPGYSWVDSSNNSFRAIMFMPNFNTLQYGQSIEWIYRVEIQPIGFTDWVILKNVSVIISNSNYLNVSLGVIVDITEATTADGNGNLTLNTGYDRQLDFFIDCVGKGLYGSTPIYPLMIKEIQKREGITIS